MARFGEFLKTCRCYQTGKKMVENAKIEKFKSDILGDFQTLWALEQHQQYLRILEDKY